MRRPASKKGLEAKRGSPSSFRPPRFWIRFAAAVRPAYGSFTAGQRIRPSPGGGVWFIVEGEVLRPREA
jgi:hypothetical protein